MWMLIEVILFDVPIGWLKFYPNLRYSGRGGTNIEKSPKTLFIMAIV